MKRLTMIALLLFIVPIITTTAAKPEVEVGQKDGCNLTPIFQGVETHYGIQGGSESAGLIKFSIDATITDVTTDQLAEIEKNGQEVIIDIPAGTIKYAIKIFYRPEKTGLIKANISTKLANATVWLKVVPQDAPLPWDVNWDGNFNREDVNAIMFSLLNPSDTTSYWRCDVNKDGQVDRYDLYLARQKLGLNPGDYNDDGFVDIRDQVDTYPQPCKKAPSALSSLFVIEKSGGIVFQGKLVHKIATTWGGLKNEK